MSGTKLSGYQLTDYGCNIIGTSFDGITLQQNYFVDLVYLF